jgi:acyl-CoA thioesterase I
MKSRVLFVVSIAILIVGVADAKRVACIGDSITYGSGIADRARDGYPAQLEQILKQYDTAWEVDNFGVSGATLLSKGDKPYIHESAYNSALASNPDIVIIKLGTNDSKPHNWTHSAEYVSDYVAMIDAFRALPSAPVVWVCRPVPAFQVNFSISPTVIHDEILPMIDEIVALRDTPVFDLYTALEDHGDLFPDGIHPNAEGAGLMAEFIAPFLLGVRVVPDFNQDGVLNLVDFAYLAQQWSQGAPAFDIAPAPDGDGIVGYADLRGLSTYWMQYPSLVTGWLFDETEGDVAADQTGQFDATLHGGPVWRPDGGAVGGALELDGVDDYVSAGDLLHPADGPFTVFAWVQGGGPGQVILSQANDSDGAIAWLGTDATTGMLMTAIRDTGRFTKPLVSEVDIADGNWHHLRLVWDGLRRFVYVDGQEALADTRDLGTLKYSRRDFFLGVGEDLAAGTFFAGLVDEFRVYNVALKPVGATPDPVEASD